MKKWSVLILMALFFCSCAGFRFPFSKKGKQVVLQHEKKKETPYEKLLKRGSVETVSNNFITLHKIDGKLLIELPVKSLDREMLLASTASESSDPVAGVNGYKPSAPMYLKFIMRDSAIFLQKLNYSSTYDGNNEAQAERIKKNAIPLDIKKMKIEAWKADSSAMVFDVTELFTGSDFAPVVRSSGMWSISAQHHAELSKLAEIKASANSVTIKSYLSYTFQKVLAFIKGNGPQPLTIKATRTIMLLPETKMRPRLSDLRIGSVLVEREHVSNTTDGIQDRSFALRWRLEPKDTNAYLRGELVEPVKPIVFYVDTLMPVLWNKPVKEGILRWNKAFEKIGFKNAIQVLDFPKDSTFDPDNMEFSCIRYNPLASDATLGQFWIDPASGEILNATIILNKDIAKKIIQSRFVQTAQVDESVRSKKIPDALLQESIAYEVAYQMGHCLGLLDNVSGSAAYPVDSLRSASFTQKYGTTASIMDYGHFNYVAQPNDKGVKLTPANLGPYDELAIKYIYTVLPNVHSTPEELPILEHWLDEHVGDLKYRYGKEQEYDARGSSRQDPSAIEEDLGDDPIKASEYGIKNLKYIAAHLNDWIKADSSFEYRQNLYEAISDQYYRYLRNVMNNIGGIYLADVKEGTPGEKHIPVSRAVQKASLKWLMNELKTSGWLDDRALLDNLGLDINRSSKLSVSVLDLLLRRSLNIVLAAHLSADPYTVEEFTTDLFNEAFAPTIQNRKLTPEERIIQKAVANVSGRLVTVTGTTASAEILLTSQLDQAFLPSVDDIRINGLDHSGFVNKYIKELRELERMNGNGYTAKQLKLNEFGSGYGNESKYISVRSISDLNVNYYATALKIVNLLKGRMATADINDKAHYQSIYFLLQKLLVKQEEYLK